MESFAVQCEDSQTLPKTFWKTVFVLVVHVYTLYIDLYSYLLEMCMIMSGRVCSQFIFILPFGKLQNVAIGHHSPSGGQKSVLLAST